ncbi:MAG: hypothetical protein PHF86_07430 [Candidatus Nanoarchaeia archaeon]|jgi:regulator of replication initiation timing|nr:hypothetical protein [Candidatus Nanoarchaeia archaeon]
MDYPWFDKFAIEAAEDTEPDEETGTNEPVSVDDETENVEEQPDTEMAKDLTEDTGTTESEPVVQDTVDVNNIQEQIDGLKTQIEDMQKNFDLEDEVKDLKRRIENISVPDETNTNDDIFQSASLQINYIKRSIRRFFRVKTSKLSGKQQKAIEDLLEQKPSMSSQEIALQLSKSINASDQDIIDFIRNSEFRFRHRRHGVEASVIDWNFLNI